MASASKLEKVNRLLKSVLTSEKGGVAINRLQGDYHELTGDSLPFREFGYPSLEAYLRSIPHVVSLQRGPDGATICRAVSDETIEHITSLVSRQRSKKKVGRAKPSRYARPNFMRSGQPWSQPQKGYKPLHTTYAKQVTSSPSVKKYPKWPPKSTTSKYSTIIGKFLVQPEDSRKMPAQSAASVKSAALPTGSKELPAQSAKSTKSLVHQMSMPNSSSVVQHPTRGSWSGKHGSKRSQSIGSTSEEKKYERSVSLTTELSGSSSKSDEKLYITVDNDDFHTEQFPHKPKGKTKGAANKKQEWSSNFEVPPRFKKLMSPPGRDSQDYMENNNVPKTDELPVRSKTQLNSATTQWVQKILQDKPNGIWASALCEMHQKELGSPLEASVVNQMAKLSLITKESIYNNDIIYPKTAVSVQNVPVSKTTASTVTQGNERQTGVVVEETDKTKTNAVDRNNASVTMQYKFEAINSALTNAYDTTPTEFAITPVNSWIASNPSDAQLPSTNWAPSPIAYNQTMMPSEPSEGWGSPIIEAPGVPSLVLPEEDDWDVYVAYIKSLADFYVILIGDYYSEQLIALEEDMRTFYQCCTWMLTEPPKEGDCNVAELNREWLRVEVQSVKGDKVMCFLLDHGDIETADVDSLKPLAENFLQVPFQVVHCKLAGSEQVASDDSQALQMFCQLALGKNLLAEVVSREGDRIEMELFDASDVSILEQCLTAGI